MMPFGITARGDRARIIGRIQEQALAHDGCENAQQLCSTLIAIVEKIPEDAMISLGFTIQLNYSTEERIMAGPREVGI